MPVSASWQVSDPPFPTPRSVVRFFILFFTHISFRQARRQGGCKHTPSEKGLPDAIIKDLFLIQNVVVMVGLTVSVHF